MGHHAAGVATPALRAAGLYTTVSYCFHNTTIGNIVTGDDLQTQVMINAGLLPQLMGMVQHPKKSIRKEACWTISNITAGLNEPFQ